MSAGSPLATAAAPAAERHPPSTRFTRLLRNKFVAGLIILIPIMLTVKAIWWLFTYVDGLAEPLVTRLAGRTVPGVGFVTTLALVFLTGLLFSKGPLRRILDGVEGFLDDVPLVGTMYGTTKKVLTGFGNPEAQNAFQRFVLAQLPGRTTPGFLTGTFELTRRDGTRYTLCAVYIPTNHLYVGDVVVLPRADVIETDMSVEDGISLILSAGASVPSRILER
ncbi:MAG TPA: DUF502 domain-containing protein [Vicinamibacteria bacterium]